MVNPATELVMVMDGAFNAKPESLLRASDNKVYRQRVCASHPWFTARH